ncbi:MAG: tetraacyldisaccharide 4'-kinase [Candidatus Omnitrophica bacterium]|nr:tetraacyldisaccharide 4'-kinase [Candidatus Omnitrophota bacterium]MCM8771259.1 tetraacyldisaccharide 4'-kinase [Candidatus Omnitrophota bacterium]
MRKYLYEIIVGEKKGFLATVVKLGLLVLSLFYGLVLSVISLLYKLHILRSIRLNTKVISIGNITWGGTAKTPLVAFIASYLRGKGYRIAILSRGYKRKMASQTRLILNGRDLHSNTLTFEEVGDEALLLSQGLADVIVGVDKDRIRCAQKIRERFNPDIFILDDGFQYWRLYRDLDIVTIDATNPFGNQHILPAGIMRQPKSALKRADIFVITKTNINPHIQDLESELKIINPRALIVEAGYKILGLYEFSDTARNLIPLSDFKNKSLACLCGIADPASFEKMLYDSGINIVKAFRFPDHHYYTKQDMDDILTVCKSSGIEIIITTEKDLIRLKDYLVDLERIRFFVLKIELKIKQDEAFTKRISCLL